MMGMVKVMAGEMVVLGVIMVNKNQLRIVKMMVSESKVGKVKVMARE